MRFEELPKEKQEALMMLGHKLEIEEEDDKRRQSTRLGYRLGGQAGLVIAISVMVIGSVFLTVILALAAPSLDINLSTSPLYWLCFLPIALTPILPFLFLKPRYALKAMAVIVAIFAVCAVLASLAYWLEGRLVDALV